MNSIVEKIGIGFETQNAHLIYTCIINLFKTEQTFHFQKHPLGFKFCNLGKLSVNQELRLHVWDRSENIAQDQELQIHDHSFDFESFVVSGKIKNTVFHMNENHKSKGHLYEVKFVDNKSFLEERSGQYYVEIKIEEEIAEGSFYFLSRTEFHKSETISDISVTLIKMIKPSTFKFPKLFSEIKAKEHLLFSRSRLHNHENIETINLVTKLCKQRLIDFK